MERNGREEIDGLALFGIVVAVIGIILGPGMGCYAIAMGWPW